MVVSFVVKCEFGRNQRFSMEAPPEIQLDLGQTLAQQVLGSLLHVEWMFLDGTMIPGATQLQSI